jgi:alkylation response protein AidB-like acyl-CoA dehydrogenase
MAKLFGTESAGRVVELAMEVMGPQGLRAEWNMERYLRDVRVTRIYEGTSEIQKWVIARELLGEK